MIYNHVINGNIILLKKDANGIWLHTDQFIGNENIRTVLILMYVHKKWDQHWGGELKIFNRENINTDLNIPLIKGYQWNKPMDDLKNEVIRADTVGGEVSIKGEFDYSTVTTIVPKPNRVVIMDHSEYENIHGVLPCFGDDHRLVVQQWLSFSK